MIVHELVTNCVQHAYPDSLDGDVHVSLTLDGAGAVLRVSDDGIGTSPVIRTQEPGPGLAIVSSLVHQIRGTMEFTDPPGTTTIVRFDPTLIEGTSSPPRND
ncbi:MAG: sensor histidine kinase [Alkalispirochaeta sp.]